jgi:hypothetical protein
MTDCGTECTPGNYWGKAPPLRGRYIFGAAGTGERRQLRAGTAPEEVDPTLGRPSRPSAVLPRCYFWQSRLVSSDPTIGAALLQSTRFSGPTKTAVAPNGTLTLLRAKTLP